VDELTSADRKEAVAAYIKEVKKKTERERIAETRSVTGVFSGAYGLNPLTGEKIPIWISEYVLAGYGTGAIMAVPAHDSRDYAFARRFDLPIVPIIEGCDVSEESFDAKEGKMCNSGFLNGLDVNVAIERAKDYVEEKGLGRRKTNYRLRDAIFSRQRYWGEPFPIYYRDGIPCPVPEEDLPLTLPEIDSYKPTGEAPLARAKDWTYRGYPLETSTMPGFAGSSAYYLRYMDPSNDKALVSREADDYWRSVDLYVGGTEHATGHLIYSRFWNKFLYDLGYVCEDEPFRKLVNQGMIQGRSNFVYRIVGTNTFVSEGLRKDYETTEIHVDVNIVYNDKLDLEAFRAWRPEFADAEFILEDGEYRCGWAIEKMSKSMYNVVNPDLVCDTYGADTLRLYEMFLGPVEQSKPWDTKGIDGVNRFLKKLWRLFYNRTEWLVTDEKASSEELKVLHKLIGKEQEDIENFSYNTTISAFMIAVNDLTALKCSKREILEPVVVLLSPFAPHIAEELWERLGHEGSVSYARFPEFIAAYAAEDNITYPVQFNGKMRFTIDMPRSASAAEVEAAVRAAELTPKYVGEQSIVKLIVVPGRIVNVVVK
jgi:leucyl-tRNA synthetase